MKKKALPLTLALALMAIAGTAYAQSTATTTGTDTSAAAQTAQSASKDRIGGLKGKGGFGHGASLDNTELLTLLGLDAQGLRTELQSGKSLSDIAAAKGVSDQTLTDLLVKQESARLDQAVTDGKLTQAQADERKAQLSTQVAERIKQQGTTGFGKGHGGKGGRGGFHGMSEAAGVLGMTEQEVLDGLKAGKSLSEIAAEKGVDKQKLIDALLQKEKERIKTFIDQKHTAPAGSPSTGTSSGTSTGTSAGAATT
ncbi:hypothetical protein ACP26L_33355 [Paenibacillus sp. S-38]|uniref:hypothetical protein n=1 Tax=Paenibacillus sp. S-38 TaxID=3416710 RepID=UPI003CE7054D